MSTKELLINEIEEFPDYMLLEILDFALFLKTKINAKPTNFSETAILSESTLGKDWLRQEEDEAWQDL